MSKVRIAPYVTGVEILKEFDKPVKVTIEEYESDFLNIVAVLFRNSAFMFLSDENIIYYILSKNIHIEEREIKFIEDDIEEVSFSFQKKYSKDEGEINKKTYNEFNLNFDDYEEDARTYEGSKGMFTYNNPFSILVYENSHILTDCEGELNIIDMEEIYIITVYISDDSKYHIAY